MSVEQAVRRARPTWRQWQSWADREPLLAGMDLDTLRAELRRGPQERTDALLTALVRLAQHGPHARTAALTVARCLLPGLHHRAFRYSPWVDQEEAMAVLLGGLVENIARYDPTSERPYVAARLLSMPTQRLRRAARVERRWGDHDRDIPEPVCSVPAEGPGIPQWRAGAVLLRAVRDGIIPARDAWLIWATRIEDMPLRHAADTLGLGYEAGRKRRQRAESRCGAWWNAQGARTPPGHDQGGVDGGGERVP